jgi:hypothetical protein
MASKSGLMYPPMWTAVTLWVSGWRSRAEVIAAAVAYRPPS